MMVWRDGWRVVARRVIALAWVSAALAACGGGDKTDFVPQRILAFGDESSVLLDSGDHNARKYTVNAVDTGTGELVCTSNPIWIQSLALQYSMVFPECNPNGAATGNRIFASAAALATDVQGQVDRFLASSSFVAGDLATLFAGANDVLAEYDAVVNGGKSESDAIAAVEQAAAALGAQVDRIASAGAKVLIVTLPNLAHTPFGRAEEAATPGRGSLLAQLTQRFNTKLRVSFTNDGRKIGLVLLDEQVGAIVNAGSLNTTDAPCAVDTPDCTTLTLVTATSPTMPVVPTASTVGSWLWSDATHLGVGGHAALGSLAISRITTNPF